MESNEETIFRFKTRQEFKDARKRVFMIVESTQSRIDTFVVMGKEEESITFVWMGTSKQMTLVGPKATKEEIYEEADKAIEYIKKAYGQNLDKPSTNGNGH